MKKKYAIFTTGWCAEILSQFLQGMTEALKSDPTDLFLFLGYATYSDTTAKQQGEMNIFTLPDLHDFDGAVIFASGLDYQDKIDDIRQRCDDAGIPLIIQGAKRDGISYVVSDNYQATKEMCAHLLNEHGVKTIAFMAGNRDSYDSEERLRAVRDYLRENHCEEALIDVFYTKWENAIVSKHVAEMCASGEPLPDAFICANDGLAMVTCLTLTECGFEVPRDTLVTGYDYLDDSKIFDPAIASMDQCFEEMGRATVRLIKERAAGGGSELHAVIQSKFVPGESCGCFDFRDSDKVRRRFGREVNIRRSMTTYFNRKLELIDSTVLSCQTYDDFKEKLRHLLATDHDYEGTSFHVLLDPNFSLSIYDSNVKLNTHGYSKYLEVLYSSEDGRYFPDERCESRELIPGYSGNGSKNHLYVFLSLHEEDSAYGYVVFRDCLEKIENRYLHTYKSRMGLVFDKFRHALTMDLMNKRLMNLMRRDPLTHVNNRVAYEDKEQYLQAQIISDPGIEFAIVMFDVNNLKQINDTSGHEAGDEYLVRSCHLICNVFKHSPVYRIGGDEFVAVLTGEDYENRDALMARINEQMSPYSETLPLPSEYVSIACGISSFDASRDSSASDVAKRADEEMYRDKAAKKSVSSGV